MSETFTPAGASLEEFDIAWEPAVHGTNGPVQAPYPPFYAVYSKPPILWRGLMNSASPLDQAMHWVYSTPPIPSTRPTSPAAPRELPTAIPSQTDKTTASLPNGTK